MQTARCPLYIFCELYFDRTKNVYFRMKLRIIQHVNKTPWVYVQQGKWAQIGIQKVFLFHLHVYTYLHSLYCLDVKEGTT